MVDAILDELRAALGGAGPTLALPTESVFALLDMIGTLNARAERAEAERDEARAALAERVRAFNAD